MSAPFRFVTLALSLATAFTAQSSLATMSSYVPGMFVTSIACDAVNASGRSHFTFTRTDEKATSVTRNAMGTIQDSYDKPTSGNFKDGYGDKRFEKDWESFVSFWATKGTPAASYFRSFTFFLDKPLKEGKTQAEGTFYGVNTSWNYPYGQDQYTYLGKGSCTVVLYRRH